MNTDIEIKISKNIVNYNESETYMMSRVKDIISYQGKELIWFLEHPEIYTAGTSACDDELIDAKFPVFNTGRGGKYTYHGPGQLVIYLIIDLKKRNSNPDIKSFINTLQKWVICSLADLDIASYIIHDKVGVWVRDCDNLEKKISSIGIRIKKWVTYHGISINIFPELQNFDGIIPCGIKEYGVTSIKNLGIECSIDNMIDLLLKNIGVLHFE